MWLEPLDSNTKEKSSCLNSAMTAMSTSYRLLTENRYSSPCDTLLCLHSVVFVHLFTAEKRIAGNSFLPEIKAGAPPTDNKLKAHVSVCRLDLTMAVRYVGWISTRMASLMSFWLQLQCISAQETRRLAESTSTPSVG